MSSGYICQKCKQPLQLDASLADLTPSSYDLLTSTLAAPSSRLNLTEDEKLNQVPAPANVKNTWKRASKLQNGVASPSDAPLSPRAMSKQPQRSLISAPNESFVFLQDSVVQKIPSTTTSSGRTRRMTTNSATNKRHSKSSQVTSPISPSSHKLKSANKLFSLLSSRTEIDHPLCTECTDSLLRTLSEQLKDTMRERDGYLAFEKELKKERQREEEPADEVERRIERLKEEERLAIEDLLEAQAEKEQLDEELNALELEEKELEEEESE